MKVKSKIFHSLKKGKQLFLMKKKRGKTEMIFSSLGYILLSAIFFFTLFYYVSSSSTGAPVYEQKYAKQIALLIDEGDPNLLVSIDFEDALKVAEKNKRTQNLVTIDSVSNLVKVNLGTKDGYSYKYFTDEKVVATVDSEKKLLMVNIGDKVFGLDNLQVPKPEEKVNLDEECNIYSDIVSRYASKYSFDPLLIFAIIKQESGCRESVSNGEDIGLMQINKVHCGTKNLFSDIDKCKEQLKNPETNIRVGTEILNEYYHYNREIYENKIKFSCKDSFYQKKYLSYQGIDAALRLYNGPACRSELEASYVEKVKNLYASLGGVAYA